MGVPHLFAYLSGRYPLCNTFVVPRGAEGIDCDCLLIDGLLLLISKNGSLFSLANGLIHNSLQNFDENSALPEETEVFQSFFHKIEELFFSLSPQKVFQAVTLPDIACICRLFSLLLTGWRRRPRFSNSANGAIGSHQLATHRSGNAACT